MAQHGYSLGFVVFKLNMETIFNSYFHLDGGVELWKRAQRLHDNIHLFTDIIHPSADCRSQKVSKQIRMKKFSYVLYFPTRHFTHCTFRFWLHAAILLYTTSQKFLNSKIFNVLLNKPAFIWSKVQQKQYNFVIFLLFKRTISYYSISVSYYFFISIWIYYKILL